MPAAQTLATLGEFGFLEQLLPTLRQRADVVIGPGDDCAVVRCGQRQILATTDALVEGVHFEREWLTPRQLGQRSLAVNLSDIAAMGGRPTFCLVSVGAPAEFPARELASIHAGIEAAAQAANVAVVGGNLTRAPNLFVSITLLGEVTGKAIRRSGARAGDGLYVTGTLGDAALAVEQLRRGTRRGVALRRYREPEARLTAGGLLAKHRLASAMIDVSDGLLQDLGHLAAASRVGAVIDVETLPYSPVLRRLAHGHALELATRGGEDYELLFAVPPKRLAALERLRPQFDCSVTHIGTCVAARHGIEMRGAGREVHLTGAADGWDHFRRT